MNRFGVLAAVVLLVSACSADRVDLRTVRCALNSYGETPREVLTGNAVSARAGLIIGRGEGSLDVWRGCSDADKTVLKTAEKGYALAISVSPSGRYLLTSQTYPVEEIDLTTGKSVGIANECTAAHAAFSPDGRFALLRCLGGIQTLDLASGKTVENARLEPANAVTSMAANAAFDLVALGTGAGEIHIASIEHTDASPPRVAELRLIQTHADTWIQGLGFDERSGDLTSVTRFGQVSVWDARSGELKRGWQTEVANVANVTFYCSNRFAAIFGLVQRNGSSYPFNALIDTLTGRQTPFATGVFSRSGSYIPALGGFIINSSPNPPRLAPDALTFRADAAL